MSNGRSSDHFNEGLWAELRNRYGSPGRQILRLEEDRPGGVHFILIFHGGQENSRGKDM